MSVLEINTEKWIRQVDAVKIIRKRSNNKNFSIQNLAYWIKEKKVRSKVIEEYNLTLIDKDSIP